MKCRPVLLNKSIISFTNQKQKLEKNNDLKNFKIIYDKKNGYQYIKLPPKDGILHNDIEKKK